MRRGRKEGGLKEEKMGREEGKSRGGGKGKEKR